jgi:hypothetical protein
MPGYDDAAAQLDAGGDQGGAGNPGAAENQTPREDTFFLPSAFPGSDMLKAGDTITLKVVGKDAEGQIEVEHMPDDMEGEHADRWKGDFRKDMAAQTAPESMK